MRLGWCSILKQKDQKRAYTMVSQMPSITSMSDSDDEIENMAGNAGRKGAGGKTVGGGVDKDAEALAKANLGKTKIQIKIETSIAQDPLILDLSNKKLQNLSDLQKLPTLIMDLQKIDVSKNYLDNIDVLNNLQHLKIIKAYDNYIRSANLQLSKLQELDLRNNFIETVPILSQMPKLQVLILNANNIIELKLQCSDQNYLNIMKINLRNNKIKFTNMEVINFVKKLKEFKVLKVLSMENNPFLNNTSISNKIIKGLPKNLEMYNSQKRVYIQSTVIGADDGNELNQDAPAGEAPSGGDMQTLQSMPTLENLLYNLEAANSHPNQALKFLKLLYQDADKIVYKQETQSDNVFLQQFTKAKDQYTIKENIETFMQHSQLLVDNHFELRTIMLQILSKLTTIKAHEFGVKCFSTLRDLMVAGRELEEQVMEQLNENVIQILIQAKSTEIPVSILIGLKDLVERQQSHQTDLMNKLFREFFPKWLLRIKDIISSKTRNNQKEDMSDQIDAILALLVASLRDDEINVMQMYQTELHETLAEIFLKTPPQKQPRYLHLLDSMNQIAKMHSASASEYIDKFIHRELLQEIKLTFYQYKKSQELYPADNKDNIAQTVVMYKTFSAQITLVASLLNAGHEQRELILRDNLIDELLQVLTHNMTDPLLLTAICYLAEKVFMTETINQYPDVLADKINRIQSCEGLLPYLGLSKYKDLLKNTVKYNSMEYMGNDNSDGTLEYNNDPIIHTLFIQIIRLIMFFCKSKALLDQQEKEAVNGKIGVTSRKLKGIFKAVCDRLNESNRELALFRCIEIPNDDVKLTVVNCLYYVPIDQIDSEEIDQLLKLMQPQNIGAGKTELVLAVIFNILSNMVKDTKEETSQTFKNKFSYTAITLAMNIMIKNQEREVDDEEEEEKYTLQLSILNFLKYVSRENQTKEQLKGKGEMLKRILYAEQQYTKSHKFIMTPVEIETTQMGKDFESLRGTIQSSHQMLRPYNYISFRVLHQMANLLEHQSSKVQEVTQVGELDADYLRNIYHENLLEKIKLEKQFWRYDSSSGMSGEFVDIDYLSERKKHHKVFTRKNGMIQILLFLTSMRNEVENWLRMNQDQAIEHAGNKENHTVFGRGLKYKIKKQRIKLQPDDAPVFEESKKRGGKRMDQEEEEEESKKKQGSQKAMFKTFMEEELGSGYQVTDTDMYLAQRKGTTISNRLKQRDMIAMNVQNPELRSLCVAAYLRCAYASIDSAPNAEYHEQAINNFKGEKIFTQLTQLCASTGWLAANIGSKYLQLMRYITRVDTVKRLEDSKNLIKYEILSIVITRNLGLLEGKIKNENNNQELTADDINLLCHLAVICNQLVSQSTLFDFRKAKTDQYDRFETDAERTIRHKLIDFQMSKLFPLDMVQILIDVIFQEMQSAQKRLHSTNFDYDSMQAGNKTLEHTKKFLSRYLAYCEKYRYEVQQYLQYNVVFGGKTVRNSFLEEILEDTNQIQVSNRYIDKLGSLDAASEREAEEQMTFNRFTPDQNAGVSSYDPYTLAYKQKKELLAWLDLYETKQSAQMVQQKRDALEISKFDCSLGERILFSQPMPVYIRYTGNTKNIREMRNYFVYTVIMTNLGVYIIDDFDMSAEQDPDERKKLKVPNAIERFTYSAIKKVIVTYHLSQRIVLNVIKNKEYLPNQLLKIEPEQGLAANTTTTNGSVTDNNVSNVKSRKGKQSKLEQSYVTLVVPNLVDSVQIRAILDEAVTLEGDEDDEEVEKKPNQDLLLNHVLLETINTHKAELSTIKNPAAEVKKPSRGKCPFCRQSRLKDKVDPTRCVCNYHLVYAFKTQSEKPLRICTKSKQRGGPARQLSTDLQWHVQTKQKRGQSTAQYYRLRDGYTQKDQNAAKDYPKMQPRFGILAISPHDVYFMEEDPTEWMDMSDFKTDAQINKENIYAVDSGKDETKGGQTRDMQDEKPAEDYSSVVNMFKAPKMEFNIEESKRAEDYFQVKDIIGTKVINGIIPAIELKHRRISDKKGQASTTVYFSMMSDYNVQDSLMQLKSLIKQGNQKDEDSD